MIHDHNSACNTVQARETSIHRGQQSDSRSQFRVQHCPDIKLYVRADTGGLNGSELCVGVRSYCDLMLIVLRRQNSGFHCIQFSKTRFTVQEIGCTAIFASRNVATKY